MNNIEKILSSKSIVNKALLVAILIIGLSITFGDFSETIMKSFFIIMTCVSFAVFTVIKIFLLKKDFFKIYSVPFCFLAYLPLILGVMPIMQV